MLSKTHSNFQKLSMLTLVFFSCFRSLKASPLLSYFMSFQVDQNAHFEFLQAMDFKREGKTGMAVTGIWPASVSATVSYFSAPPSPLIPRVGESQPKCRVLTASSLGDRIRGHCSSHSQRLLRSERSQEAGTYSPMLYSLPISSANAFDRQSSPMPSSPCSTLQPQPSTDYWTSTRTSSAIISAWKTFQSIPSSKALPHVG